MGTALVVGLLVMMGGGIAYVGDTLGWRMGKRRLSLFGLRPRHTAAIFTVATGVLIASVTLGILMLASAGVRIALTRGEQLLYDNHRLKQERRALEAMGRQLTAQKQQLEQANDDLLQHNRALHTEEGRLRAETGTLLQRNRALSTRNTALSGRNEHLLQEDHRLLARNVSLGGENGRLLRANGALAGKNRALESANAHLQKRNLGLQTAKAGLETARDRAQTRLTQLQGSLIQTQSDLTRTQKKLTDAEADFVRVQRNAMGVANRMLPWSRRGQELATGTVVIHMGEELARRVIPAGATAGQVRATVAALLRDAQAEVDRRVNWAHGPARQVELNARDEPPDKLTEQTVTALMTESHPIDGRLPTAPMPEIHPLVVRALASQNEAAESDDPVEVDIGGQVNQLAFRRGEEVSSLKLDTAATSGQLMEELVSFLQGPVRKAAMEHAILPDASGSVGKIEYEPLLEVVRKVKRMPGQVRVGAVAAAETWTAGPLHLDFYVVPAPTRVATDEKRK